MARLDRRPGLPGPAWEPVRTGAADVLAVLPQDRKGSELELLPEASKPMAQRRAAASVPAASARPCREAHVDMLNTVCSTAIGVHPYGSEKGP